MSRLILLILFAATTALAQSPAALDIRLLGARSGAEHDSRPALQRAIDSVARQGGGTVYLPNGTWRSGTLFLKSGVRLYLEAGATLLSSPNPADYDSVHRHFLYAADARNIGIDGPGTFYGNERYFRNDAYEALPGRPLQWLHFERCTGVRIRDTKFVDAPGWNMAFSKCDDVVIDGISILSNVRTPNTDGVDLRLTSNVRIANSRFVTGDDAICLKAREGTDPQSVVENITVTNCIIESDDAGIKLGTGSGSTIRYCTFENIILRNTRFGLALFMKDGGSYEHIRFSGIQIECKSRNKNNYPFYIDLDQRNDQSPLGRIHDISFSDIHVYTAGNSLVAGHPRSIASDITFRNVTVYVDSAADVSTYKKPKGAREVSTYGVDYSRIPAQFTFAHIRGLRLENLRVIERSTGAPRHGIWMKDVNGVLLRDIELPEPGPSLQRISTEATTNLRAEGAWHEAKRWRLSPARGNQPAQQHYR